jgi:colanic acid biosynthesis glycosyl transferase WcaI
MAQWLAAQGHDVRVVTAPPYYPQWRVAEGYANWWSREELQQSLQLHPHSSPLPEGEGMNSKGSLVVYRCPLWVPVKPSGLKRLLHLASFALTSFPVMLRHIFWRPDVVLVVEPPLFCAPQAWLVARLSGAKAWLHIQDYEVDAAFDLGLLKGAALRSLVATSERWLMRRFDRVSTISQRMVGRAVSKGVPAERVVLFRNWVDIKQCNAESGRYRTELGIAKGAVVALYSGNMGGKQGLEILAQTATLLRDVSDVVFVFCGNGAGRDDLLAQCAGLSNVRFLDLQPAERLSELLAMADIHLLPQRADAADLVMPSKLTGMLASARPLVATARVATSWRMWLRIAGWLSNRRSPGLLPTRS